MKIDAKKLYPQDETSGYVTEYDYTPIINAIGQVVLRVDDHNYQGDTFVMYRDYDGVGFLTFGWGSCSGCDALQACTSIEEVQELCDELQSQARWFRCDKDALEWAKNKDWETEWIWHTPNGRLFIELATKYLEGIQ